MAQIDYVISKDAGVNMYNPYTNYGSDSINQMGWQTNNNIFRYLLYSSSFSFTPNIVGVYFYFNVAATTGTQYTISSLSADWGETSVTFYNAPFNSDFYNETLQLVDGSLYRIRIRNYFWGLINNHGICIGERTQYHLLNIYSKNSITPPFIRCYYANNPMFEDGSCYQNGNNVARLRWTSLSSEGYFNKYIIRRDSDVGNIVYQGIGTAVDTTQTNGTTKTYYAKGYYVGDTSVESSTYDTVNVTVMNIPYNVSVSAGNRQATINWTGWAEAAHYHVYHSTTGYGYSLIADNVTGTSYTHSNIASGIHYYAITASYAVGESGNSVPVNCSVTCNPPVNVIVTGYNRQSLINWSACSPQPQYYELYHSTNDKDYSLVSSTIPSSQLSYSHTNIRSGTRYYKLKARYSDGDISGYSTPNSGIIVCDGPSDIGLFTDSDDDLGVIKIGNSSTGSFENPGEWIAPPTTNPTEYKIYRAYSPLGVHDAPIISYTMISTVSSPKSYIDLDLYDGTWWYRITAFYGTGETEESA
ncbi:MAG: hypothetical protein WC476_01205 [Phycisphaerae bacterium]|jgi:hypothetical protein